MVGLDDEVEYIWINSITGVSYADTIDFLLSIKQKNEKILSKPMIKVAEDGKIVGVITETNQFVSAMRCAALLDLRSLRGAST